MLAQYSGVEKSDSLDTQEAIWDDLAALEELETA